MDDMQKTAKLVQRHAEEIHCASAIHAIEKMVTAALQEKLQNEVDAIASRIDTAVKMDDIEHAKELLEKKEEINRKMQKAIARITVSYEERLSLSGARLLLSDVGYAIVLPQRLQQVIRDGIETHGDGWSEHMVKTKIVLRNRTAHELGHIVNMIMFDEGLDEKSIEEFAGFLLDLRNSNKRAS